MMIGIDFRVETLWLHPPNTGCTPTPKSPETSRTLLQFDALWRCQVTKSAPSRVRWSHRSPTLSVAPEMAQRSRCRTAGLDAQRCMQLQDLPRPLQRNPTCSADSPIDNDHFAADAGAHEIVRCAGRSPLPRTDDFHGRLRSVSGLDIRYCTGMISVIFTKVVSWLQPHRRLPPSSGLPTVKIHERPGSP